MKHWTDKQLAVAVKAVASYSLLDRGGEDEYHDTLKVLEFLVGEQVRRAAARVASAAIAIEAQGN